MPHHLTSFVAALTGSISSGTCCGCIPFTFSPAVAPAVASSTAPLSAALPNAVIPTAVASQGAVSSTPVLTSVMAFFAPFLTFYKKYNIFEEPEKNNKSKADKKCQCNLINNTESDSHINIDNEVEQSYQNGYDNLVNDNLVNDNLENYILEDDNLENGNLENDNLENDNLENYIINENTCSENEETDESNINIKDEIFKEEIILLNQERSLTSEYSMHSFLEEKEIEHFKNTDSI